MRESQRAEGSPRSWEDGRGGSCAAGWGVEGRGRREAAEGWRPSTPRVSENVTDARGPRSGSGDASASSCVKWREPAEPQRSPMEARPPPQRSPHAGLAGHAHPSRRAERSASRCPGDPPVSTAWSRTSALPHSPVPSRPQAAAEDGAGVLLHGIPAGGWSKLAGRAGGHLLAVATWGHPASRGASVRAGSGPG